MNTKNKSLKVLSAFMICLLVRLIPFRAPNVEPLLSVQMPYAKRFGGLIGFSFGFASILIYDIITGKVGIWTLITAFAYGFLGLFSALFFKNREATRKNFIIFAIFGTILYDALTGLTIGPLFFHESFTVAFIGQIPFTALHLFGNVIFSALLSPAIYRLLIYERAPQVVLGQEKIISAPITN